MITCYSDMPDAFTTKFLAHEADRYCRVVEDLRNQNGALQADVDRLKKQVKEWQDQSLDNAALAGRRQDEIDRLKDQIGLHSDTVHRLERDVELGDKQQVEMHAKIADLETWNNRYAEHIAHLNKQIEGYKDHIYKRTGIKVGDYNVQADGQPGPYAEKGQSKNDGLPIQMVDPAIHAALEIAKDPKAGSLYRTEAIKAILDYDMRLRHAAK